MVNLTHPELAEITNTGLPPASIDALKTLRNQMCSSSSSSGFSLQSQQKFLRRVLSPDAPTRSLLMVHGTGTGKTCTAIQIAEEYILRPEFQDKKVMVLASRAVQENFRTQIFDMSRANLDPKTHILSSKQCTGRRYLDMLLRLESEPRNWADETVRARLDRTADRIIDEFYEFSGYASFGARINEHIGAGTAADLDEAWIHENFDNRLLIIDEAHNIRESADASSAKANKAITEGLERLVKVANGMVLVLLTATPMFESYDEIVYYMNLFGWNERTQDFKKRIVPSDIFTSDAELKSEEPFRAWCQKYVSYVKGENPFTFPFRLPPPNIAPPIVKGFNGTRIGDADRLKYISLVASEAQGIQKATLVSEKGEVDEEKREALMLPTVAVLPGNKGFDEVFRLAGKQFEYVDTAKPFLTAEHLANHSAKFASIVKSIESSKGMVFVYSNYKKSGARLFAMALEEHGFRPARGETLLSNPSSPGTKGKYILLTSDATDADINAMLDMAKSKDNRNGDKVRVVIASPVASEGVDFRFIRQVHILDPWWNMSRIEQVVGRALRTCSHQLLPFEEQNCSVYLHVCRVAGDVETFDEYTYRTKVETKALKIAKVRKVMAESAMDCPLQTSINTLPADWKSLVVPQRRSEEGEEVSYSLHSMMAPAFDEFPDVETCKVAPSLPDPDHVRPLSSYLDVRDEILEKLAKLFVDKPIWDRDALFAALAEYNSDVVVYNLQQAITGAFRFADSFGRASLLESRGDLYTLAPIGVPNSTMIERTSLPPVKGEVPLPPAPESKPAETDVKEGLLDTKREAYKFPGDARERFSEEVLNGFVFDHEFSDDEKRSYLHNEGAPLPFASRLRVPGAELLVLGPGKYDPPEEPIGEDLTRFNEWTTALIDTFVSNKDKVFASLSAKTGKFSIAPMTWNDEGVPTRVIKQKKFEPTACATGGNTKPNTEKLAKYIDKEGVGIPAGIGAGWCTYVELLAREEHNIVWVTPEELGILLEESVRPRVSAALK